MDRSENRIAVEGRRPRLPQRRVEPQGGEEVRARPLLVEAVETERPGVRSALRQARAAAPVRPGPGAALAAELRGREALRRAVLMQEILDPPVALRDDSG
jgi:hypothetical protein